MNVKFSELPIEKKREMFLKHCEKYYLHPHEPHNVSWCGFENQTTQFFFSLFCVTMELKDEH